MTHTIHRALPKTGAPVREDAERTLQPRSPKPQTGFISAGNPSPVIPTRDLRHLGREFLKTDKGEAFSFHYHAAVEAAGALKGKEFLQQHHALKRTAHNQGVSEEEFRRYEKCLYQHFYRAAAKDTVRARQSGRNPKVNPDELAYIAKVADIPEGQIRRDALTFQRCEFVAQILALKTRHKDSTA